jgi:hypothetical protein
MPAPCLGNPQQCLHQPAAGQQQACKWTVSHQPEQMHWSCLQPYVLDVGWCLLALPMVAWNQS